MTDATSIYIARLALAVIVLILIWAATKIWREAPAEFHATLDDFRAELAEQHWLRIAATLACFAIGFITVAFLLATLLY